MKRLIVLTSATLLLFLAACDSKFIDDIFTFNVEKSFELRIPAGTPAGRLPIPLTVPLLIDSATLAKENTTVNLLKSAKLTKLQIVNFVPSTFSLSNIDTLDFRIESNNQPLTSLAYYSSGMDTIRLTLADFAPHLKDAGAKITADAAINTATTEEVVATVNYTITFSAHPF